MQLLIFILLTISLPQFVNSQDEGAGPPDAVEEEEASTEIIRS